MSARGRKIFDRYASTHLRGPLACAISLQSHVHNLLLDCREQGVPHEEIVEEVGELMRAIEAEVKKPPASATRYR